MGVTCSDWAQSSCCQLIPEQETASPALVKSRWVSVPQVWKTGQTLTAGCLWAPASGAWPTVTSPTRMPCSRSSPRASLSPQQLCRVHTRHLPPPQLIAGACVTQLPDTAVRAQDDLLVTGIKNMPSLCATPRFPPLPHLLGALNAASGNLICT